MNGPIFDVTENQLLGFIQKLLEVFKKVLAWLGILVLPEPGEDFPGRETTTAEGSTGV